MNAKLISPRLEFIELPEVGVKINMEDLATRGIEINAEDIRGLETRGKQELFAFKGNQVVLYIDQPRRTREQLEQEPLKGPKLHMKFCQTLERMDREGRYEERYIMTMNPTGIFTLIPENPNSSPRQNDEKLQFETRVYPCQHCLAEIRYNGFTKEWDKERKEEFVKNFVLRELFEHYGPYFEGQDYKRLNRQPEHAQVP